MTITITHVKGDLIAADESAIAHGCNCEGKMGAGIAKLIREAYQGAYPPYKTACDIGSFYPGVAQPTRSWNHGKSSTVTTVYNLATQDKPGPYARYEWVYAAFQNMFRHMKYAGIDRVAIPRIGAGIGGLEWERVEAVINAAVDDMYASGITVVVYTL